MNITQEGEEQNRLKSWREELMQNEMIVGVDLGNKRYKDKSVMCITVNTEKGQEIKGFVESDNPDLIDFISQVLSAFDNCKVIKENN